MSTVADKPKLTLRQHLQSDAMKAHLANALPTHVTPDRLVRVALTAMTRSPKLANCTQASFFQALFQCSQMGLEPDGRRAHLIPYGTECQLVIDYKGFAELAYRSALVKSIHAQEVREGDIFEFDMGQVTRHTPHFLRRDPGKPKDSGKVFAYYCVVEMAGDARKCEVMSLQEVEAIRDKSQGYKAFKAGKVKTSVWNDYPIEMGKKTVFKRCSKWLPLSAEIRTAIEHDDADYVENQEQIAQTVDSISGLLLADSDVNDRPEGVGEDGEIIPFNPDDAFTRFADCTSDAQIAKLSKELTELHPDHELEVAAMADGRKDKIERRNK
jgi:recombination protein RecT